MMLKVPDIVPLLQPDGTGMCGQAALAMAAGVTLDEATLAVGATTSRSAGVTPEGIIRGAQCLGLKTGKWEYRKKKRVRKFVEYLPRRAIMSITRDNTPWGHWVLLWDGFVYDPGAGWPIPLRVYEDYIIDRAYSKTYAGNMFRAYWDDVIPILGRKDDIVTT